MKKPRKPSKNDLLGLVEYMREASYDAPDEQIKKWWIRCADWIEAVAK